jgi:hypothetical protein
MIRLKDPETLWTSDSKSAVLTPLLAFPSLFRLEKSRLIDSFLALYRVWGCCGYA